jgi:hypothetical protein
VNWGGSSRGQRESRLTLCVAEATSPGGPINGATIARSGLRTLLASAPAQHRAATTAGRSCPECTVSVSLVRICTPVRSFWPSGLRCRMNGFPATMPAIGGREPIAGPFPASGPSVARIRDHMDARFRRVVIASCRRTFETGLHSSTPVPAAPRWHLPAYDQRPPTHNLLRSQREIRSCRSRQLHPYG